MDYKSALSLSGTIKLGEHQLSPEEVIDIFSTYLKEERLERLEEVSQKRSFRISTIVENLYDRGNISAVMRSAEAFGFIDFNIIERPDSKFKDSNRISRGTEKWLNQTKYESTSTCVERLKTRGYQIVATHLDEKAKPIELIDFSKPTALVFGNEKDGISEEMASLCDETMIIPMQGFAQSFNISVAAAISFYHVYCQRQNDWNVTPAEATNIYAHYILRSLESPLKILEELESRT